MSQSRRLAAILAADVVGYSRLMGADEEGTLERLKRLRQEVIDPHIEMYRGTDRYSKTTGAEVRQAIPHSNAGTAADRHTELRIE
jgi:adenylate cyclase